MNKLPSPNERPDLYDDFDGINRPDGWVNPVAVPDRIQAAIDARKEKATAKSENKK